jgi:hypothetical protein
MAEHGTRNAYAYGCRCEECTHANALFQRERRARRMVSGEGSHGESGYFNYGCRCEICKNAAREKNRIDGLKRKERGLPPDDPRHGTMGGYNAWYCRCEKCKAKASEVSAANYQKRKARRDGQTNL